MVRSFINETFAYSMENIFFVFFTKGLSSSLDFSKIACMPSNKLRIRNIKTKGYAGARYRVLIAGKDEISINARTNNLTQIVMIMSEFII